MTDSLACLRRLVPAFILWAVAAPGVCADADVRLGRAESALLRGDYGTALVTAREVLAKDPAATRAHSVVVRTQFEQGQLAEALAAADAFVAACPQDARGHVWRARILRILGRMAEAEEAGASAFAASPEEPAAHLARIELLRSVGRYAELGPEREWFAAYRKGGKGTTAGDLFHLAQGLWILGVRQGDVEICKAAAGGNGSLLDQALQKAPADTEILCFWARCYAEKSDTAESAKIYAEVLGKNARLGEAVLGGALGAAEAGARGEFLRRAAEQALSLNPALADAWALLVQSHLDEENVEAAKEAAARGLEELPAAVSLRAMVAAMAHLEGDDAAYAEQEKQVLQVNPRCGDFYLYVGRIVSRKLRFEEARTFYDRAVEVDPENWDAMIALGLLESWVGNEAQARKLLEAGFARDPFQIQAKNLLDLLDALDKDFVTIRTEHFILKLDRKEAPLLGGRVADLHETAWRTMRERYGFEPEVPVLSEMFSQHGDFSVRTMGLPGLGALGACFGKVVTLLSPKAKESMGPFNWGVVVWHELAHVFALQLSRGRVPRWFTEGLSTYEEGLARESWARELQRSMFQAHHSGSLATVPQLAHGGGMGNQILHLYEEGALICRYIDETYGFDGIVRMLRLWGEGRTTAEVFSEALDVSLDEFQEGFAVWTERWASGFRLLVPMGREEREAVKRSARERTKDAEVLGRLARVAWGEDAIADARQYALQALDQDPANADALLVLGLVYRQDRRWGKAAESLRACLEGGVDAYEVHYTLAEMLARLQKTDEALAEYEAAIECFPHDVESDDSPYERIAKILDEGGDPEAAAGWRARRLAMAEKEYGGKRDLAKYYLGRGEWDAARKMLEDAVFVEPRDLVLQGGLADAYRRLGLPAESLAACDAVILLLEDVNEVGRADKMLAKYHARRADLLRRLDRIEEAADAAHRALQYRPDYEPALRILEELER